MMPRRLDSRPNQRGRLVLSHEQYVHPRMSDTLVFLYDLIENNFRKKVNMNYQIISQSRNLELTACLSVIFLLLVKAKQDPQFTPISVTVLIGFVQSNLTARFASGID